jgi:hypothetical protein
VSYNPILHIFPAWQVPFCSKKIKMDIIVPAMPSAAAVARGSPEIYNKKITTIFDQGFVV